MRTLGIASSAFGEVGVPLQREDLTGEARVLALADAMRASGGAAPHRLHDESVRAFRRGEVAFDEVTRLYRHAMVHAGAIVRRGGEPFRICPHCEATLGRPADG
jgi:hypothetical protein